MSYTHDDFHELKCITSACIFILSVVLVAYSVIDVHLSLFYVLCGNKLANLHSVIFRVRLILNLPNLLPLVRFFILSRFLVFILRLTLVLLRLILVLLRLLLVLLFLIFLPRFCVPLLLPPVLTFL